MLAGLFFFSILGIEEGLNQKTRQRSSRRIGGQNPCRASCFACTVVQKLFDIDGFSSHHVKTWTYKKCTRTTFLFTKKIGQDRNQIKNKNTEKKLYSLQVYEDVFRMGIKLVEAKVTKVTMKSSMSHVCLWSLTALTSLARDLSSHQLHTTFGRHEWLILYTSI